MIFSDTAMNIFGPENLHFCQKKPRKNMKINSFNIFLAFSELVLVFYSVFCSSI